MPRCHRIGRSSGLVVRPCAGLRHTIVSMAEVRGHAFATRSERCREEGRGARLEVAPRRRPDARRPARRHRRPDERKGHARQRRGRDAPTSRTFGTGSGLGSVLGARFGKHVQPVRRSDAVLVWRTNRPEPARWRGLHPSDSLGTTLALGSGSPHREWRLCRSSRPLCATFGCLPPRDADFGSQKSNLRSIFEHLFCCREQYAFEGRNSGRGCRKPYRRRSINAWRSGSLTVRGSSPRHGHGSALTAPGNACPGCGQASRLRICGICCWRHHRTSQARRGRRGRLGRQARSSAALPLPSWRNRSGGSAPSEGGPCACSFRHT